MILVDTNILGTFARVNALELLFALFRREEIGLAPAVYAELLAGIREGRQFLQAAIDVIESGRLKLIALTADEVVQRQKLPASLDDGEAESIVLCQVRDAAFITNDRRARNFCLSQHIEVFDLIDILRALWKLGIRSKRSVRQLVKEIEGKERMVIKHRDRIFDE